MHTGDGEMAAWADGASAIDFAVDGKGYGLAPQKVVAEVADQLDERFNLLRKRSPVFEIANEADTYPGHVDLVVADVATLKLADPAVTDFDLSPAGCAAIADDKVIGESVFHTAFLTMVAIIGGGIAVLGRTVVADNILPAPTGNLQTTGYIDHILNVAGSTVDALRLIGYIERLPNQDPAAAQSIGPLNIGDAHAKTGCDRSESISAADGVTDCCGAGVADNQSLADRDAIRSEAVQPPDFRNRHTVTQGDVGQSIPSLNNVYAVRLAPQQKWLSEQQATTSQDEATDKLTTGGHKNADRPIVAGKSTNGQFRIINRGIAIHFGHG